MNKCQQEELFKVYKALLDEGATLRFYPRGNSMRPFFQTGRSSVLAVAPKGKFSKGDILIYPFEGVYTVHRVHQILEDGKLIMLGDGNVTPEPPMDPDIVIGKVTTVCMDGKTIPVENSAFTFKSRLWDSLLPVRRMAFSIRQPAFSLYQRKNKEIYDLLTLIDCAMHNGKQLPEGYSPDWGSLVTLIIQNRLDCIVGDFLLAQDGVWGSSGMAREAKGFLASHQRERSETQRANNAITREIFRRAKDENIPIALLKGLVLADCYTTPEQRISDDADIYAPDDSAERIDHILVELGFTLYQNEEQGQPGTISYTRGDSFYLEVHRDICMSMGKRQRKVLSALNLFSADSFIPYGDSSIHSGLSTYGESPTNGGLSVLDHTEHLVYLVYHTAKHLQLAETEGRMLCDFALYIEKYRKELDFERFWSIVTTLGLDRFTSAIIDVCIAYFGLRPDTASAQRAKTHGAKTLHEHERISLLREFIYPMAVVNHSQQQKLELAFERYSEAGRMRRHSLKTRLAVAAQLPLIIRQVRLSKRLKLL